MVEPSPSGARSQRRILVVEDEAMVAMLLEDMLADIGLETIGPVGRLSEAVDAARTGAFEAAILDVNLAGQETYPVADVLIERGIPFVFATGYGVGGLRDAYRDRPVLQKPFQQSDLEDRITALGLS